MAKAAAAKRSYQSPLREERAKQTRDAVLEAAGQHPRVGGDRGP
jgi:hypothetical protein